MTVVPIEKIQVTTGNPRKVMDPVKLDELASSIRERGILQPLVCRISGESYELIAGRRRLEAAKLIGLREVPVVLRETDDADVQFDQVVENLQREDMSVEDKYQAFNKMKVEGLTIANISKRTGVNATTISSILALENLSADIRRRGDIDEYPKQLIARTPQSIQLILADRVSKGELGIRCLLADVLPTLNKVDKEEMFDENVKAHVAERIARETIFKEYPARAILAQEIGKIKMEKSGVKPKVVSLNTLQEYLLRLRTFQNTLAEIQSIHLQYLDKGTVLKLYIAMRDIRDHLDSLLAEERG